MSAASAGQAWRIGAFALAGLAVLLTALVASGGRWFGGTERALMRFQTSVWGLQVGAPVVLRGVRVGEVESIGLEPGAGAVALPVVATLDARLLRELLGPQARGAALPVLVAQGLVARLSTQSLLTGLLYVDLEFDPARAGRTAASESAAASAAAPSAQATVEVPTAPTRLQTLQAQLEGLELARLGRELVEVSAGLRQLLAEPGAQQALRRTAEAARSLQALSERLQAQSGPLADALRGTLDQTRRSAAALEPVARDMSDAARQVSAAASQAGALAAAGVPAVARAQQAADELARAAAALRAVTADDSSLRQRTDEALGEVARAARALRELAELLEKQPDAILRGKR